MAGFVAENAHAPLVVPAFDLEHLALLEPLEPRMRKIEGHSHRGVAVGRKPLLGQIEVNRKAKVARFELGAELVNPRFDSAALDLKRKIGDVKIEQLLVWQIRPVGRHGRARHSVKLAYLGAWACNVLLGFGSEVP